jgi:hypothetical protein
MNPDSESQAPQPAIGLNYGVDTKKLLAAAEQADVNRKPKPWQRFNRDALYLTVIAILALLLIVTTGFVVSALTNRNVTVSFRSGNTTTPSSTDTTTDQVEPDETVDEQVEDTTSISANTYLVFLESANPAFDMTLIPAGSVRVEGTTADYLIKVPVRLEVQDSLGIAELVKATLSQQDIVYKGMVLTNKAYLPDVEVTAGQVGDEFQIDLVGEVSFADKTAELEFKQQLEQVITEVAASFFVTINGDELAYSRLGLN